jgi:hypothetical protein
VTVASYGSGKAFIGTDRRCQLRSLAIKCKLCQKRDIILASAVSVMYDVLCIRLYLY